MRYRLIRLFKLQTTEDKVPGTPDGYGVMAPAGFEVLSAFMAADGLAVSGFCSPNGVLVWHPMVCLMNDVAFTHADNMSLMFIDLVPVGTSLAHIFAQLPWPTSTLEGAKPAGEA